MRDILTALREGGFRVFESRWRGYQFASLEEMNKAHDLTRDYIESLRERADIDEYVVDEALRRLDEYGIDAAIAMMTWAPREDS